MAPEPTVTLTLTATETARLHDILQNGATVVNQSFTAAPDGACACGGHTAASPVGQMVSGDGLAQGLADEQGPVTRDEYETLVRRVEELEGEIMSQALGQIDAVAAALPLPPDLEDAERWRMPVTAAFDETKHPRHPKGGTGGGRFRSLVRAIAEEDGRVALDDPRLDEAATEGGTTKGKVVEQVNMVKRRIENGSDAEFEATYAQSQADREADDTLEALAGRGPTDSDEEMATYYPDGEGGYGPDKKRRKPGERIPQPAN